MSLAGASQLAVIVFNPESWSNGQPPSGWQLKVTHGRSDLLPCTGQTNPCIGLRSSDASFGLERSVDVDLVKTPNLAWDWKVTRLPEGGDFRYASKDDQAAQVLVAFADRRVLTYIWDSTAPKGAMQSASSIPFVHIYAIVCESGLSDLNRWVAEVRDVAADYERAFGKPAPHVKGLRIQINSQHTGSIAESYFGPVVFRANS